jgi:MFS family permease
MIPLGLFAVILNPDPTQLPGADVLQKLTDGIGGWALIAALVGMVIGAVAWAFGQHSQNYQQAYSGRKGVIISGAAALLIGAAPHVVSFFSNLGTTVK